MNDSSRHFAFGTIRPDFLTGISYEQFGLLGESACVFAAIHHAISSAQQAAQTSRGWTVTQDARSHSSVWHPDANPRWFPSKLVLKFRFSEHSGATTPGFADPDKVNDSSTAQAIDTFAGTTTRALTSNNSSRVTAKTIRSVEDGINTWGLNLLIEPSGDVIEDSPLENLAATHGAILALLADFSTSHGLEVQPDPQKSMAEQSQ